MKAAVKTEWVADLRANPDAQGHGFLDYIDSEDGKRKQCCLGRLCLLAVAAGVIPPPVLHDGTYYYLDGYGAREESFSLATRLPWKVSEWARLPVDEDGYRMDDIIIMPFEDDSPQVGAIEANDGMGMTFAEIADLADKNVPAE